MFKRFGLSVLFTMLGVVAFMPKVWSEPEPTASTPNFQVQQITFESLPDTPDPNDIFKLVNMSRTAAKVPPLRANKIMAEIAAKRAFDMTQHQYFAHKNQNGQYYYDLFGRYGIDPGYSCENLDLVFVADPQSVINEWLGSLKGHRECMLNDRVVEAGYATAKLNLVDFNGSTTTAYVVVAIHSTAL